MRDFSGIRKSGVKGVGFCLLFAFWLLTAGAEFSFIQNPQGKDTTAVVRVRTSQVVGRVDPKSWANIGYDPMFAVTVADEALPFWKLLRETGAFRYIRMHNLFSDGFTQWSLRTEKPVYCGNRIYTEDSQGKPHYNFWHLDEVLDILLSAGLKPILEADFMPDDLSEGEVVRNYCGGAVNTPRDYRKWRDLIYFTVKHLIQRYGIEEVRQWYFEIWNEPDLKTYFIDGVRWNEPVTAERLARFHQMYDYFADGAKSADARVKVGGPGIAGNQNFFRAFLQHVTGERNYVTGKTGSPIDFISWHHYGEIKSHLSANQQFLDIIRKEFPSLAHLETQQNEWGQPLNRRPEIERQKTFGVYEAVFLVQMVEEILSHPEARVDLFLRWGQPVFILSRGGGWRALSVALDDSIAPFPILNAYLLLSKMGSEQVALEVTGEGTGGLATRSSSTDAQILLYRTGGAGEISLSIDVELPADLHQITLTEYRMDEEHGNVSAAWEKMGSPKNPNAGQIQELQESARLKPLRGSAKVPIKNGHLSVNLSMKPDSLLLLVLGKESTFTPGFSPHIQRVIQAENMYLMARQEERAGRRSTAKSIYEKIAREYSDLFWSQRALFQLLSMAKGEGKASEADSIRQRLLKTTLNDTDRLELLKERKDYLTAVGRFRDALSLHPEIQALEVRIQRFKTWSRWSR